MLFDEDAWPDEGKGENLKDSLFGGAILDNNTPREVAVEVKTTSKRKRKKVRDTNQTATKIQKTSDIEESKGKTVRDNKQTSAKIQKTPGINESANVKHSSNAECGNKQVDKGVAPSSAPQKRKTHKRGWKKNKLSKLLEEANKSKAPVINTTSKSRNVKELKKSTAEDLSPASRSDLLCNAVTSKLESAQFRFINEQLYTRDSKDAKKLFLSNRKSFDIYHSGFNKQVSKWPVNPLDQITSFLRKKPAKWVIGDFGCGDAKLAASLKNTVYSFDLIAVNSRVTVADIANVPLENESLDVAVFCLSLMGTNYMEFLIEANRALKPRGLLLIAEVASRFTSVQKFIGVLKKLGFDSIQQDKKNTHFFSFNFVKTRSPLPEVKPPDGLLKPCVYKKR